MLHTCKMCRDLEMVPSSDRAEIENRNGKMNLNHIVLLLVIEIDGESEGLSDTSFSADEGTAKHQSITPHNLATPSTISGSVLPISCKCYVCISIHTPSYLTQMENISISVFL